MNLISLLVILLLSGCNLAPTEIDSRHSPLHPQNNANVNFSIEATDNSGIKKVELFVFEYEMYLSNDTQSAQQRPGGVWGLVQTWNYAANIMSIAETHTVVGGFPANTYVTYIFKTTNHNNKVKTETWNFAAGDWPYTTPVPLLGNGDPVERIDICFVADNDSYTNARDMLPELEGLIFDGYFSNSAIGGYWKRYWSFYYVEELGHITDYNAGPPYEMDIPESVSNSNVIDHAAVIHTLTKRDWAWAGNFGTEPINIGTAVHESAHAAFNLKDEYSGGGHSVSLDPYHNNYGSEASCDNYTTNQGWGDQICERIQNGWWRPEPASDQCIMLNDGDDIMPSFGRSCLKRVYWFYGELEAQQ
jgi:hypothetical protein